VQVADRVIASLDSINAELPRGITLEVLSDNTSMIRATLNEVYKSAYQGALLTMIILFIFLRNIKGTLIIGLAIPITLFLTLMCMTIFGFTLNLLTMTGLIMGLGMTVDGAIIIIDNVYSYRARGAKPNIAAILGSREMITAIMASTTTTLCVFVPLIIYKNDLKQMGQLFNDLIFTVIISMACSMIVAVTLVPSLCGAILKLNTRKQKPLKNRVLRFFDNGTEKVITALENGYKKAIGYCLSHRLLMILLVSSVWIFSVFQFSGLGMNMYFRSRTDDNLNINVSMPQGTTIDVTEKTLYELNDLVKKNVEGYRNIILTAQLTGTNQGTVQITLPEPALQIDTPDTIIRKLTPFTNAMPGMRISYRAGRSMGSTSAIEIAISSNDYNALIAQANEILRIIRQYLPEIQNPAINIDEGAPQLTVQIDRDRAAALGVSLTSIASVIRTAINGTAATTMSRGNRLLNVTVILRDEDQAGKPNLDAIFVTNKNGNRISLANMATIAESRAPSSIRRENQERVIRLTGDLPGNIAATDMQQRLIATVNEYLVPREGVRVSFQGEAADINTYTGLFIMIIALAAFLVFGVLASQFESFVDPFIIFFSVPLLLIGVVWIYKLSNQPMSMFSMVGIVALVGVVLNNGIILVDYTNTLRARGMKVREACMEAGRRRLRPILMTSLTTIFAMAPVAFFPGAGADTIQPIAKTFVGGISVSSFMTLFLIPSIYSLVNTRHDKRREKEDARREAHLKELAAGTAETGTVPEENQNQK
ncbi:MAG: efflux RND transporter permease subunit, partial [Treponema sp.]|nr:efflux RND transporter permease subunit [Treponema sp.]